EKVDGAALRLARRREDRVEADIVEDEKNCEDAEREAEIADAVHHEGLDGGGIGGGPVIPETDQQIGGETDSFPAEEKLDEIVRRHQHQHGEGEQREIGEEARLALVL